MNTHLHQTITKLTAQLVEVKADLSNSEKEREAVKNKLGVAVEALEIVRSMHECRGDYYDGIASAALRIIKTEK